MATPEPESAGALAGLRVIDAGLLVQGPQAAQMLHELGADVVKVEQPGVGDHARWVPISRDDRRAPYFIACNRGKRSITIDLRGPAGRTLFRDLAITADIVISNFAAGTMDGWGLGFADLRAVNPGIILATGTAYGTSGAAADHKGADIGGQAAGGLMYATGDGSGGPTPVAVTIADHIASQNMVAGVLAAVIARGRTGQGQHVETSLLAGQVYAQASEFTAVALTDEDLTPTAHGGHPLIPGAYGVVPTKDGALALVGIVPALRGEFFTRIGRPELVDDERFTSTVLAGDDQAAFFAEIEPVFRTRTTREWLAEFADTEIRHAPVRTRREVLHDPDSVDKGLVHHIEHPEWGRVAMVDNPVKMSATPPRSSGGVPELGQHTEEILLELGRSWDDIAALREAGAI